MAIIITLVVGTNTFGTYQEAENHFAGSMSYEKWCVVKAAAKKRALVAAFDAMNGMVWDGEKTDPLLVAAFPRTGLTDIEGNDLASDSIPVLAKQGQFELAAYLIANKGFVDKSKGQVKKVGAGSAKVEFFENTVAVKESKVFPEVIEQYFRVLSSSKFSLTPSEASGTSEESHFSNANYGTV